MTLRRPSQRAVFADWDTNRDSTGDVSATRKQRAAGSRPQIAVLLTSLAAALRFDGAVRAFVRHSAGEMKQEGSVHD
jgi:hypothetical protein